MRFYTILFLIVIAICGVAQVNDPVIYETTGGEVSFVSEAPLEIIKASSDDLHGLIRNDDRTFAFTLKTKTFKGFNSALQQEHFYENYIESVKFPYARFKGKIIEPVNLAEPGEHTIRAKGILEIHGVEQERVIRIDLKIDDKRITAHATFDVLLEDHNITIPKMVFQKIAEKIEVDINTEFRLKN